jgi:hypothetical protein
LMMSGVSPETCWAIKKHWNNTFYYTVASCWFFLWDLVVDSLEAFYELSIRKICGEFLDYLKYYKLLKENLPHKVSHYHNKQHLKIWKLRLKLKNVTLLL